ncbi:hypothetical protein GQX74_011277 [Glossina fuscipes]|nr:hypothetical protein GQX74_011277 [Glossina fuscipes]
MAFNSNPPLEKNIIGVSYRLTCIIIALVLLCANLTLIISFPFRHLLIKCNSSRTGIESFIVQYGDIKFAISGLILGVLNCAFDIVLLIGAITIFIRHSCSMFSYFTVI